MILTKWFDKRKKEKQRKLQIQTAKKILIGTAAGSVSGIVGGLLFSPKSGKETREDIAKSSKDITNNIIEKTSGLKETIDNKVTEAKGNVIDAKDKIKQKSIELKEVIDNKVSDAKENVTDAKGKISQYLNEKKVAKVISETEAAIAEDVEFIVGKADKAEKKIKNNQK